MITSSIFLYFSNSKKISSFHFNSLVHFFYYFNFFLLFSFIISLFFTFLSELNYIKILSFISFKRLFSTLLSLKNIYLFLYKFLILYLFKKYSSQLYSSWRISTIFLSVYSSISLFFFLQDSHCAAQLSLKDCGNSLCPLKQAFGSPIPRSQKTLPKQIEKKKLWKFNENENIEERKKWLKEKKKQ